MSTHVRQRADYTFKYNRKLGRHGWLRLTPAYSVKLVENIMDCVEEGAFILDPFSGTGTTGLVAAEYGLPAHCADINPFLVWLGNTKCRNYSPQELKKLSIGVNKVLVEYKDLTKDENWLPEIHNISRWWHEKTLGALGALRQAIVNQLGEPKDNSASSLAWVSFCRLVIATSSAAFNHVSMSFKDEAVTFKSEEIGALFLEIFDAVIESAKQPIHKTTSVYYGDSIAQVANQDAKYSHVITSPPYPNRISYIRELRPYMYWTKFLDSASAAGELDWSAIGGTWGVATSRLQDWDANGLELPNILEKTVSSIINAEEKNALLMANYVHKYFHDMHLHLGNIRSSLKSGATIFYIVGNSSFYGIPVPTDKILESSLTALGFTNVESHVVRKRNSKKELFEYCICATWGKGKATRPPLLYNAPTQRQQMELRV